MQKTRVILGLMLAVLIGCQTVHTSHENSVPLAMWAGPMLTARQGQSLESRQIVASVLRDNGLHPTLDAGGVSVAEGEEARARETLLTDPRLQKTDVIVFLGIPAGTGRRTAGGFEVPVLAPPEPMQMPSKK